MHQIKKYKHEIDGHRGVCKNCVNERNNKKKDIEI